MPIKKMKVDQAVGKYLAHDITKIIPDYFKGVGFRKDHIIQVEDIPELRKIGKEHIYIYEPSKDESHENEAALRIAQALCGNNLDWTKPNEGKSNIYATCKGLLKINVQGLLKINYLDDIIVSTLKTMTPCDQGQTIAATRIIPLLIKHKPLDQVEEIANEHYPILQVCPYLQIQIGGIVTGTEVYNHLIPDSFEDKVSKKVEDYGCSLIKKTVVPDDKESISQAILEQKNLGCQAILITGGLSVDPDDVTKAGIERSGANIITYGSPILPGAMFLYALLDETHILGLPACVYYFKTTVFDLMFPRIISNQSITPASIAEMGHGGLCLNCYECRYPICPFGK